MGDLSLPRGECQSGMALIACLARVQTLPVFCTSSGGSLVQDLAINHAKVLQSAVAVSTYGCISRLYPALSLSLSLARSLALCVCALCVRVHIHSAYVNA